MRYDKLKIEILSPDGKDLITTSKEVTTKPVWPWGTEEYTDQGSIVSGTYETDD